MLPSLSKLRVSQKGSDESSLCVIEFKESEIVKHTDTLPYLSTENETKQSQTDTPSLSQAPSWTISMSTLTNWISKTKLSLKFGDAYEIHNGGIWRFALRPNVPETKTAILFVQLETLPANVSSLKAQWEMKCPEASISILVTHLFDNDHRIVAWPVQSLRHSKIEDMASKYQEINFNANFFIEEICEMDSGTIKSWQEYIDDNKNQQIDYHNDTQFEVDRKTFTSKKCGESIMVSTLSIKDLQFEIYIFPKGIEVEGNVEIFINLSQKPNDIVSVEAHFCVYSPQMSIGYSQTASFTGKTGLGMLFIKKNKTIIKYCMCIF